MQVRLYRKVENRWRTYQMSLAKNLFGTYVLECQYGSYGLKLNHEYKQYFQSYKEAHRAFRMHFEIKWAKGYQKEDPTQKQKREQKNEKGDKYVA